MNAISRMLTTATGNVFVFSMLNKIALLLMQYATSFLLCNRSFEVYTAVS